MQYRAAGDYRGQIQALALQSSSTPIAKFAGLQMCLPSKRCTNFEPDARTAAGTNHASNDVKVGSDRATARGMRYPKNTQSEPYDRQDAEILVADFANRLRSSVGATMNANCRSFPFDL